MMPFGIYVFLAEMTPLIYKIDNRQISRFGYTLRTISKTIGEQKWLQLAQPREQVSIFAFNAVNAPT